MISLTVRVRYTDRKDIQGHQKEITGFEPVTCRSAIECSTTELYPLADIVAADVFKPNLRNKNGRTEAKWFNFSGSSYLYLVKNKIVCYGVIPQFIQETINIFHVGF